MTIMEIQKSDKPFLTPGDIADVIRSDPQTIRIIARDCPERLGFPVSRIGKYTKIPRIPFLRYIGFEEAKE